MVSEPTPKTLANLRFESRARSDKSCPVTTKNNRWVGTFLICSLGYFMDVFDLLLFSVLRVQSLKDLGLTGGQLTDVGADILRWQMGGILFGAFFWGVAGDRLGRKWVILGSIFVYSIATLLCAAVADVQTYRALRFFAGFGLAGELGAAIVLVAEILPQRARGYGTTGIAAIGALGAIAAALLGELVPWRVAFLVGGILGLVLLFFRRGLVESDLFKASLKKTRTHGNLLYLFWPPERTLRYLSCVALGLPVWFAFGIVFTFAPEIARSLQIQGSITAPKAILFNYVGFTIGDIVSGLLSQKLQSRKKVVGLFLAVSALLMTLLFRTQGATSQVFYMFCALIGFSLGYWVLFVTMTSESFGTNLRSTVGTSVPQVLRATVIPMAWVYTTYQGSLGTLETMKWIAVSCFFLAALSLLVFKETFAVRLDYLES